MRAEKAYSIVREVSNRQLHVHTPIRLLDSVGSDNESPSRLLIPILD